MNIHILVNISFERAKHYGSQKTEGQNNQNQSLPTLSLDIGWLFSLKKFQIHLHIFTRFEKLCSTKGTLILQKSLKCVEVCAWNSNLLTEMHQSTSKLNVPSGILLKFPKK